MNSLFVSLLSNSMPSLLLNKAVAASMVAAIPVNIVSNKLSSAFPQSPRSLKITGHVVNALFNVSANSIIAYGLGVNLILGAAFPAVRPLSFHLAGIALSAFAQLGRLLLQSRRPQPNPEPARLPEPEPTQEPQPAQPPAETAQPKTKKKLTGNQVQALLLGQDPQKVKQGKTSRKEHSRSFGYLHK